MSSSRRRFEALGLSCAVACLIAGCQPPTPSEPLQSQPLRAKRAIEAEPPPDPSLESPKKPWRPPTRGFDKEFLSAASFLFKLALPDPRGKLYSVAEVPDLDFHATMPGGGVRSASVYGWIRSGPNGRPELIALDGLEYDTVASFHPVHPAPPASAVGNPRLAAAMLLIAGRTADANALLAAAPARNPAFADMAAGFLRARWQRILTDYAEGDDKTAMALAQETGVLRQALFAEANRRKERAALEKRIAFLDQAPALIAQIRAEKPQNTQPIGSRPQAIARLIDELGDIGNPAFLIGRARSTVRVHALTDIWQPMAQFKTPAVDALVADMGIDKRLSRTIEDLPEGWRLTPVSDWEILIFAQVTHAPQSALASPAAIRAWWEMNRDLPPPEWDFRILADDGASSDDWLKAAQAISGQSGPNLDLNLQAGSRPGESQVEEVLRRHVSPSVTELMNRRLSGLLKQGMADRSSPMAVENQPIMQARQMLGCLRIWDPPACDEARRKVDGLLLARARKDPRWKRADFFDPELAGSLAFRVREGDAGATSAYIDLLAHTGPGATSLDPETLQYYTAHRTEARFKRFAEVAFLEPARRFVREGDHADLFRVHMSMALQVAQSPALGVPEELSALLLLLKDRVACGEIRNTGRSIDEAAKSGAREVSWLEPNDPLALATGRSEPYRPCDAAMERLAGLSGVPRFKPYWRTNIKDAAVAKTIALLQAHKRNPLALLPPAAPGRVPQGRLLKART